MGFQDGSGSQAHLFCHDFDMRQQTIEYTGNMNATYARSLIFLNNISLMIPSPSVV